MLVMRRSAPCTIACLLVPMWMPPNELAFICSFTLSRRALTEFVTLCDGARAQKLGGGSTRLDLIS